MPKELRLTQAVIIGDYGWGSDPPIVLDLRGAPPSVRGSIICNEEDGAPGRVLSGH